MPFKTPSMESMKPGQPSPQPFEAPSASPTRLSTRKKPAGKPSVNQNKVRPDPKKKVTTPGLGMVSITTH